MKYKLKEIFDLHMGKTPSRNNAEYWNSNEYKWISIADLSKTGKYIRDTKEHLSKQAIDESGIKLIPANTVVMSFKLSIGKTAITAEDMYSNEAIMAFHDKHVVDILPEYLFYMFKFKNWDEGSNKAVMGKTLNKATLSDVEIDVCSIEKQREIVDILNKIMNILENRDNEIVLLDNLIKARFVELFGDPQVNPFGWDTTLVGDVVASCEAGWSGNGTQREKEDGEIAVLKVSAVTKGYFIPEECKVLDDQDTIKKYVYPQAGDLLFSRANTREMVGATAVITQDYPEHILPDKLWKIRFLGKANVWYMKYVLSSESIRSIFSSVSTGTSGSMFNVSMDKFKSIRVPLPPIERQQQFAIFVAEVDKSKVVIMNIRIFVQATAKRIEVKNKMTQKEYVIEAMRRNGGYATFQQLNQMVDFSTWKTKTPQASIRQIVQVYDEFFRIRPGLWALTECKDDVLRRFDIVENDVGSDEMFTHSYYQGIIVELGNMHNYTTYVPNQDKNKKFLEKKLCEITTEPELPDFTYEVIRNRAKTVDVIWFNERRMPFRFYEVEHPTNITNSLDKFYELQDFRADFYIIADESRRSQFNSLMERNIYSSIRNYVRFFNYNNLINQYSKESALMQMDRL